MNRRSLIKTSLAACGGLLLPAGVLALAGCSGTSTDPELVGFDGKIMGTGYSVRLGVKKDGPAIGPAGTEKLAQRIYSELQDVDRHMSTWRVDSELSVFNNSADTDWQPISIATAHVIAKALETSKASSGAFDATIGPLVDLWGFGSSAIGSGQAIKPSALAIRQSLASIGYQAMDVDLHSGVVRKQIADARLDLSGIAKGHAVDRVAHLLESDGFDNYLVEVGGELKAKGVKPDNTHWKVAIERPAAGPRNAFRAVSLTDSAIATSGNYRNFFIDDGQHYSHSIDPRTGNPVTHQLVSVSVAAKSAMMADALSTALMIMGPVEAIDFAKRHKIAAHLIMKSGGKLQEVHTELFDSLLS